MVTPLRTEVCWTVLQIVAIDLYGAVAMLSPQRIKCFVFARLNYSNSQVFHCEARCAKYFVKYANSHHMVKVKVYFSWFLVNTAYDDLVYNYFYFILSNSIIIFYFLKCSFQNYPITE